MFTPVFTPRQRQRTGIGLVPGFFNPQTTKNAPGQTTAAGFGSGRAGGLGYGKKRQTAWNVDPNKVLGFLPGKEYDSGYGSFARLDARTRQKAALDFFGKVQKPRRSKGKKSKKLFF
jgi:hypothetical protein